MDGDVPLELRGFEHLGNGRIPKERYTSPESLTEEWERLWTRTWLLAGDLVDLPRAGDCLTFEIGTESILVVKAEESLRAFYNVCQHRGRRLRLEGRGHVDSIVCPYHHWTWGLDGRLEKVPGVETFRGGVPPADFGLAEIPCATAGGFVWINMDPDCEPLEEYLDGLQEVLAPWQVFQRAVVEDVTIDWDCNWKASVDAFSETYHAAALHPKQLLSHDETSVRYQQYGRHGLLWLPGGRLSRNLAGRDELTGPLGKMLEAAGIDTDGQDVAPARARTLIQLAERRKLQALGIDDSGLPDEAFSDILHVFIFPNSHIQFRIDSCFTLRHRPHPSDPHRMSVDKQTYRWIRGDSGGATEERPEHQHFADTQSAQTALPNLPDFMVQDGMNLPFLQQGMASRGFRGSHLSDQEILIRHMHHVLDGYLAREA